MQAKTQYHTKCVLYARQNAPRYNTHALGLAKIFARVNLRPDRPTRAKIEMHNMFCSMRVKFIDQLRILQVKERFIPAATDIKIKRKPSCNCIVR
jgi:hypothetical protein